MRKVLIVSPAFVPVNAADMQRVRISLSHFREFGWDPILLTVDAGFVEGVTDPMLAHTVPADVPVFRVAALPARWTRKVGLGNLGLRAFPFLHREGRRLIRQFGIDLAYFSTTVFPAMALGRLWKKECGVPFVLDMQDPWVSDYHKERTAEAAPPKFWFMNRVHRILEPWTMKEADGLIAVSAGYIETLCRRYPWLESKPSAVIPFGAAESDFDVLRAHPQPNRFFTPGAGINGVYVGRGGRDMAPALRIIFAALRRGLESAPEVFSRIHLHFVGTSYAAGTRSEETVAPLAREAGVDGHVHEVPLRVPYFEALQLLRDSDFLVVPGSDDPQYTASKIFPYILARKPLLCLFQANSSVCEVIAKTQAGTLTVFRPQQAELATQAEFYARWSELLSRLPFTPDTDWEAFRHYDARSATAAQCSLFDRTVASAIGEGGGTK